MQLEQDIPASVQVRVYLLGPLEIWKRDPTGTWRLVEKETWKKSRPARSVFKRLLVQSGRRLSRSSIEDDLWSETDNFELATKNVYNAISLIRGVIGNSLVRCWEATYELAGQALIWTDIEACEALLKEAENRGQTSIQALPFLEQALTLFERGELLEGEDGRWCYAYRKRAEDMFRQARLWLAETYETQGKLWQAGELYRAMILTNPCDEESLQRWLEMLVRHGKRQEALKCYRDMKGFVESQGLTLSNALEQMVASLNEQSHGAVKADGEAHLTALHLPSHQHRAQNVFNAFPQQESITSLPFIHPILQDRTMNTTQMLFPSPACSYNDQTATSDEWQMPLQKMLLELDTIATQMSQEHFSFSRRQILTALATSPLTMLSSYAIPSPVEVFLPQCAASLVACNHLLKSQDFWSIKHILSSMIPTLIQVIQHSSTYQTTAAHLLTQCYLLLSILESHQLNWSGYQSLNERALQMSQLTPDKSLQVVAYVQLAMTFFHFEQPSQALSLYQGAAYLITESTPLVRSNFFVKQAVAYAQAGQITEMQHSLDQAYTHFPKKPESDPSSLFTDFSAPSLFSWQATAQLQLVRQHLKTPETLWEILSQADQLPLQKSTKVLVYVQNLRAEAALALNDLELLTHYLTLGIQGAKQLKSARRLQEAIDCYRMAQKQWPNEGRLQELAELFIEEKKDIP